jgi:hypothetical protein
MHLQTIKCRGILYGIFQEKKVPYGPEIMVGALMSKLNEISQKAMLDILLDCCN